MLSLVAHGGNSEATGGILVAAVSILAAIGDILVAAGYLGGC